MGKPRDTAAALDHAPYEIEMLTQSLFALCQRDLSLLARNVWIEVFAIHARNLNEFFCAKDFGKAYMKPDHFVSWKVDYVFNESLARRASAHVAHLTYDREIPGEKTPWLLDDFFIPLHKQCVRFLRLIAQQEPLMLFQNNKARTNNLLNQLGRIQFKEAQPSTGGDVAPPRVSP